MQSCDSSSLNFEEQQEEFNNQVTTCVIKKPRPLNPEEQQEQEELNDNYIKTCDVTKPVSVPVKFTKLLENNNKRKT